MGELENRNIKIPKDKTPIDENRKAEKGKFVVIGSSYSYKIGKYSDWLIKNKDSKEEAIRIAKTLKRTDNYENFFGVYNDEGKLCFWAR